VTFCAFSDWDRDTSFILRDVLSLPDRAIGEVGAASRAQFVGDPLPRGFKEPSVLEAALEIRGLPRIESVP
jgi:hypothetical protein